MTALYTSTIALNINVNNRQYCILQFFSSFFWGVQTFMAYYNKQAIKNIETSFLHTFSF